MMHIATLPLSTTTPTYPANTLLDMLDPAFDLLPSETLKETFDPEHEHFQDQEQDMTREEEQEEEEKKETIKDVQAPLLPGSALTSKHTLESIELEAVDSLLSEQAVDADTEADADVDADADAEPSSLAAHLEHDSDIVPALPVIEILFDETLHELFFASSVAFKESRRSTQQLNEGALLLEDQDSLLEHPLSALFSHLREELLAARYGPDAEHYEMGMVFKGLEDLWLLENEKAASLHTLSQLVVLYTNSSSSATAGVEMELAPFRIELTVQETFVSHLRRLENHSQSQAQQNNTLADAGVMEPALENQDADHEADVLRTLEDNLQAEESATEATGAVVVEAELDFVTSNTTDQGKDEVLEEDTEMPIAEETKTFAETAEGSSIHDLQEFDVDSLACYDDNALDTDQELEAIALAVVTGDDTEPGVVRSPKRTVEELTDIFDDDFVARLSPDRDDVKKARTEF